VETLFNSPDKFKSNFVTVDGYKTHYLEAGRERSDRLLLVHGGACEIGLDCYRWYPNIIPLSKHFHVYAIDELGHGQTDPPRDLTSLANVKVRAEHVIHFIDTLRLGPLHLVGQSQGGWIVTYITLTRPDLVNKLVMIDSGSTSGSALTIEGDRTLKEDIDVNGVRVKTGSGELPFYKEVFEPGTKLPKEGMTTTREGIRKYVEAFCYNKSMITEEFLDHLMSLSKKWNSLYMRHRGRDYWTSHTIPKHNDQYYIHGVHIKNLVETIRKPTLVLWGKNSSKGIDPGVELYKRIPDAQMHIFDKANHFLWLDQPMDFNSLVTWFLKKES
jgi:pimeloyl-ACP methyl ester carboxylesterase